MQLDDGPWRQCRHCTRDADAGRTQLAAAGAHQQVLPTTPGYLTVEIDKLRATLSRRPKRAEVPVTCEEQLVVEYYAR